MVLGDFDGAACVEAALPMKRHASLVIAITDSDERLVQPSIGVRNPGGGCGIQDWLFEEYESEVCMDGRELAQCVACNSKFGVRTDLAAMVGMKCCWGPPRRARLVDHRGD